MLGNAVDDHVLQEMQRNAPDYQPSTWEAVESLIAKERARSSGRSDWGRVMCYFMVHKVSGPGKVRLVMLHDGQSHKLSKGMSGLFVSMILR